MTQHKCINVYYCVTLGTPALYSKGPFMIVCYYVKGHNTQHSGHAGQKCSN